VRAFYLDDQLARDHGRRWHASAACLRWEGSAGGRRRAVRKTPFTCATFRMLSDCRLPRQARDKQNERLENRGPFSLRGYALSVGAIGARVLLDTLSDLGDEGHDAALRVVLRSEFPGWGFMVASQASTFHCLQTLEAVPFPLCSRFSAQSSPENEATTQYESPQHIDMLYIILVGAGTCWEGWDNETSPLYAKEGGHYHGSHNHAWLCGGVGEWVYSRLGGIRPTSTTRSHIDIIIIRNI
jgi:hypothetical protein